MDYCFAFGIVACDVPSNTTKRRELTGVGRHFDEREREERVKRRRVQLKSEGRGDKT
jgi:hypothetical protein